MPQQHRLIYSLGNLGLSTAWPVCWKSREFDRETPFLFLFFPLRFARLPQVQQYVVDKRSGIIKEALIGDAALTSVIGALPALGDSCESQQEFW